MTTKTLHIVIFDVPFPANYGGIIDVFYKLKSLHKIGVKLICHCFYYDGHNTPTDELNKYCETVYYYKRKKQFRKLLFSNLPYIVSSRSNKEVLNNLQKDTYPILFDGLHTCTFLNHPKLKSRKKLVRTHNIEHNYYNGLATIERNFLKRLFLKLEAKRLQQFEPNLRFADYILSISKMDIPHFSKYSETIHIPPFFNEKTLDHHQSESDKFCLFQGNLGVAENSHAVNFILDKIAPKCGYPIKIAGKNPSQQLKTKINTLNNVVLIENPSEKEMERVIQTAHINLLFTFQQTGVKLKLINALQQGKHVIINSFMNDSDLFNEMCSIQDSPEEIINSITELMAVRFTQEFINKRKITFETYFNNFKNSNFILDLV